MPQTSRRWGRAVLITLLLPLLTGCRTGTLKNDKELTALLSDLNKRNQQIEQKKRDRAAREFKTFEVLRSSAGASVTLDLEDAPADEAFLRLMNEAETPYRMGDVTLPGRVTVKAEKISVFEAARLLTAPAGVTPELRGDTLLLNYSAVPLAPADVSGQTVTRSFVLKYLTPDSAANLLNDLFPAPRPINFTKVPDLRSIYLSGPEDAVQRAIDLLMRADRDPGAVQIEAIIVSINSSAYEEFNSQFTKIANGRITDGKINVWALQESSLEFNYNKALSVTSPLSFSAIFNMLFQQQKARIIARPYITTMSGEEAEMKIGENRIVMVQQVTGGAAIYAPQAIESGVGFKITPMVLGGNMVRLNVDMTNKQFLASQGNVDVLIDNSSAKTVLTLEDGQTAIIGGLKMKNVSSSNSGLPWFRRIPILNLLTSAPQEDQSGQEVFFYITPHIVKPGMAELPDRPDAFGTTNELFTPLEKLE